MSFNNQNYTVEEYKMEELQYIPEVQKTQSVVSNPQQNNKIYSFCPFCSVYQEISDHNPYQCHNAACGKIVKQPVLYKAFCCPTCFSNILYQESSTIICSQCKKVVKWSEQIGNQSNVSK